MQPSVVTSQQTAIKRFNYAQYLTWTDEERVDEHFDAREKGLTKVVLKPGKHSSKR